MSDQNYKDPFDIEPNADGMYEIEVSDDTYAAIEAARLDQNESHSDIISRMLDEYEKVYGVPSNEPHANH